jgi:hypothetical protein
MHHYCDDVMKLGYMTHEVKERKMATIYRDDDEGL